MKRLIGLPARAAFTLLEVMISVLIVMLLAVSLTQFLTVNLEAIAATTVDSIEQERTRGLLRFVQGELNRLPTKTPGVLSGTANKFRDLSSDELTWVCKPGSGILTSGAVGDFRTTLMLRPQTPTSRVYDLGLRRRPVEGSDKDVNWLPLIIDVAAVEIRYLQLGSWVDRWNNPTARPALIRLRIWKNKGALPIEAVLTLNSARVTG